MMLRGTLLAALCMLATGCATINAKSDYDESADFGAYQTFGWISEHPLVMSDPTIASPLFEGRAMNAIAQTLQASGYRLIEDASKADFAVSFSLGARDQIRVNSYPTAYRGNWAWGGPYYQEVDVRNYTEGTLSIDLFDVKRRQPVWHGWAVKTTSNSDRANPSAVITEVIETILTQFPPQ